MANDITELRKHLFDTIRGVKDGSMDIERARAISEAAQTVINSAKVENEYIKIAGGEGSGFIAEAVPKLQKGVVAEGPGYQVRQHRLVG